jgi:hypothetical protein
LTTVCGTRGDIRFCGQKQTLIIQIFTLFSTSLTIPLIPPNGVCKVIYPDPLERVSVHWLKIYNFITQIFTNIFFKWRTNRDTESFQYPSRCIVIRVVQSLFFSVVSRRSLFILLSFFIFGHCIYYLYIYDFWLPSWLLPYFMFYQLNARKY